MLPAAVKHQKKKKKIVKLHTPNRLVVLILSIQTIPVVVDISEDFSCVNLKKKTKHVVASDRPTILQSFKITI